MRGSLAIALVFMSACSPAIDLTIQAPPTLPGEPGDHEVAYVVRAIDGDTIEVEIVGESHDVRLLGIDTPESVDPRRPVECFGKEAGLATAALLEGQTVHLVRDIEDEDSFGRLLRYVYLGDEMANARLVVNGYATTFTYPPNIRWSELFVQLQREARDGNRGLWAPGTCNGKP